MMRAMSRRSLASIALLALVMSSACALRHSRDPWSAVQVPTDVDFNGIWFADSLNGWITGGGRLVEGGIVGRTRDGGLTWKFESGILPYGGTSSSLGGVQFADTLHGCAFGSGGTILVTDDGGSTWRKVFDGRGDFFDLQLLDARLGWVCGPSSIAGTWDGGETWSTLIVNRSENGYISPDAIDFTDLRHGWLACHSGELMRSEDGGRNWTPVALPRGSGNPPTLWDVTFSGASDGWAVGEAGSIFHTRDGGAIWRKQEQGVPIVRVIPRGEPPRPREVLPELETPPDRLAVMAVRFADPGHGWAVGYYNDVGESVVLATSDGGETWETEHREPGEYLRAVFVLDARHAWAVGRRSRTAPQVVLRYVLGARR